MSECKLCPFYYMNDDTQQCCCNFQAESADLAPCEIDDYNSWLKEEQ